MALNGRKSTDAILVRPTAEQLLEAVGRPMPDIIAPDLKVLFCGINPSVYSAVVGHHFARPGNRFWKAIYGGGFTPRLLSPQEDREMLDYGCGITNVASPSTVAAADLSNEQLKTGRGELEAKVLQFRPRWLAVLGISAYRVAFEQPKATMGLQDEAIGETRIWILPNPSGLNAHYHPPELARLFGEFREFVEANSIG